MSQSSPRPSEAGASPTRQSVLSTVEEEPDCTKDYNKVCPTGDVEPIKTEFLYYSATLKEVSARLTNEVDRQKVIPWLRKLMRPEYHATLFREKRNKYLLALTITIINDEVTGVFANRPPAGMLGELDEIPEPDTTVPEWETDELWQETLEGLPEECINMPCSVHSSLDECNMDHEFDGVLDEEFTFMLFLARPYAMMVRNPEHRALAATWLQILCTIQGPSCCAMKALRNDYIMALLGYVQDLRVDGPFAEMPGRPLRPLEEAAEIAASTYVPIDPGGREFCDFLSQQPMPEEGAFCYLAVTGELLEAALDD